MELTDKQQLVYNGLLSKSNDNHVEASHKSHLQNELSLNSVSFGLVIKALSDKKLIFVEKNGGINILNSVSSASQEKKKAIVEKPIQQTVAKTNDDAPVTKRKNDSEMFVYKPEDFNQNLFFELKSAGANFSPSQYSFFSKNSDVIAKMDEIIKFYESPNDNLTKSQRTLRDSIVSKHNIDMECKKIGGNLIFLNTWGIANVKDVIKDIHNSGRKNVKTFGNRIIVEIENDN